MAEPKTTLRDIARKVNVSAATVSQALNGKGRISEQKRKQIVALLREVGYKPKTLRRPVVYMQSRKELSLHHAHLPFVETYTGLNEALLEHQLDLHVETLRTDLPLRGQVESLLAHKPGAVVLDTVLEDLVAPASKLFEQAGVPAVQVGHVPRCNSCDAVVVDNFSGARAAVRHLAKLHGRVGCIRWNVQRDPASAEKFSAYQCAMQELNLPVRESDIVESPYKREGLALPGRVAIEKLLSQPDPPRAVFVENSFISASLLYASFPHEQKLPDAIAALDIVHFEALSLDGLEQAISSVLAFEGRRTKLVRIDWRELGRAAGRRIAERLNGQPNAGQVLRVAPRLISAEGLVTAAIE